MIEQESQDTPLILLMKMQRALGEETVMQPCHISNTLRTEGRVSRNLHLAFGFTNSWTSLRISDHSLRQLLFGQFSFAQNCLANFHFAKTWFGQNFISPIFSCPIFICPRICFVNWLLGQIFICPRTKICPKSNI